jgi:DNA-binding transcriptional regulator GbsR (MarR family)
VTKIASMRRNVRRNSKAREPDNASVLRWVESVARFWSEQGGLPPITGRIVGWLMISDSGEQSAGEIAAAIGASRASLTSSLRLLVAMALVRSGRRPGERTLYYRIDDDAWERLVRRRIASLASFREITAEGLALLGSENPRARRIRAADRVYEWAENIFAAAPPCPSTARASHVVIVKSKKRKPV